ncbi:hypothetical protein [Limnohabitans sp.]|uniref:hypothetical protein n=1 Tax=Limnohabitans sp. TaxID=1907725 RepID=UPI00286F9A32|nr:hypothetical protein [Limnohabitans sp.]
MAKADRKVLSGPAGRGLKVAAKRESYYSAGITPAFSFEPRVVSYEDLTPGQVDELDNDQFLIVEEVDLPAVEEPAEVTK